VTEQPTRVLRRLLEEALGARVASAVLFEAVSAAGQQVPQSTDEVLAVVRGPLREVLTQRYNAAMSGQLVRRVEGELAPYEELMTEEVELEELVAETRQDESTKSVKTEDRAVPVVIVAAGYGFEHRLAVALGENRVAPLTVRSHEGLRAALAQQVPPIFVVDATDFPAIDPNRLMATAEMLPSTTACVMWGADLPYGRNLARTIQRQARVWTLLELREGIEPLLDLVRSRRRSR
jgi:hypothetical protein